MFVKTNAAEEKRAAIVQLVIIGRTTDAANYSPPPTLPVDAN